MRHTKVGKAPCKTGNNVLPACCEGIEGICTACNCFKYAVINISEEYKNKRNCKKSCKHHKTLEEVCPANSFESAEECVNNDNCCEDKKCDVGIAFKLRNNLNEYLLTCNEA